MGYHAVVKAAKSIRINLSARDPSICQLNPRLVAAVDWTLVTIAIFVIVAIPKSISGDGRLRYETVERFMATGHWASPKYSSVGPLLSTPLFLLGRALGAAKLVTSYYNVLLLLVALPLIWREFRDELEPSVRRMILLLLVFASMFAHHVQRYYGEVFTTVLVTIGVFWLSRAHWARGWAIIMLGAVNTPACLVGIAGIAVCHSRRTRSWLPMLAPVIAFSLMRLESLLVRGHFLIPATITMPVFATLYRTRVCRISATHFSSGYCRFFCRLERVWYSSCRACLFHFLHRHQLGFAGFTPHLSHS